MVDERIVIDQGHVDAVAPRIVEGRFRTLFRDSRTSDIVWREPSSVIMHLTAAGRDVVPDPAGSLAFVGEPGDTYYCIPQTQDPDLLWAGWSTEAFGSSSVQGGLSFSLDEIEGPGDLLVFGWSPFGEPLMRFDSSDGLPDTYAVPAVTHEHANWVFTEQGVYRLTFTVAATLASGEQVKDSQTYTMAVGDVDTDDVSLPGDSGGSPSAEPSADPTASPGADPTADPSADPTADPTADISPEPTPDPSADSSTDPSPRPNAEPTSGPSADTNLGSGESAPGDGELARTGAGVGTVPLGVGGAALVLAGVGVVHLSRRQRGGDEASARPAGAERRG
ncbi:choice-of-anchor M domain-containing protein [Streptomyces sp. NPDC059785]|uniref:choice-of-anchor M domain-containing protein n=1 Tax=Streptomyces sp. NPDC059785 TaxID=3346945 RepID=UPI00364F6F80